MRERGVSKAEVAQALKLGKKNDAPGGKRMVKFETKIYTLVVVYASIDAQEVVIITAYIERLP
jgi:hypothetical protein